MFRLLVIAAAMMLSALATPAQANSSASSDPPPPKQEGVPVQIAIVKNRSMLVDLKGMTLYYFERDDSGKKSNCDGKCTERWIPVAAAANAQASGDFTVITRNDGSKMWAFRYRPLYSSPTDKAPGDTNGTDDPSKLWHVVRP